MDRIPCNMSHDDDYDYDGADNNNDNNNCKFVRVHATKTCVGVVL
jgi:hypothetical protein